LARAESSQLLSNGCVNSANASRDELLIAIGLEIKERILKLFRDKAAEERILISLRAIMCQMFIAQLEQKTNTFDLEGLRKNKKRRKKNKNKQKEQKEEGDKDKDKDIGIPFNITTKQSSSFLDKQKDKNGNILNNVDNTLINSHPNLTNANTLTYENTFVNSDENEIIEKVHYKLLDHPPSENHSKPERIKVRGSVDENGKDLDPSHSRNLNPVDSNKEGPYNSE